MIQRFDDSAIRRIDDLRMIRLHLQCEQTPPPPPDRLFELDNSVAKNVSIPNDTFSDSPPRDLSRATLLDAAIFLLPVDGDIELEKSVRVGGWGGTRILTVIDNSLMVR